MAHQVHAVPAPVDEYDAPAACATRSPSMDGLVVKVVHDPQLQVVAKTIEMPQLHTIEEIVDDACRAIEELSRAMAEGFSAALDEVIENFDKPDGISAVIDEHFEKFDEPDKNLWSDEFVCGTWASEKGESNIFMDSITNRMSRDTCTVGWTDMLMVGKRV